MKGTLRLALSVVLLGFYALPASLSAVSPILSNADTLDFDVEFVNLAALSPDLSRLDVYVRVVYDELQFIKAPSDSFAAEYMVSIDVEADAGDQIDSQEFKDKVLLPTIEKVNSRQEFKMSRTSFELPPGSYIVNVKVEDPETKRSMERSQKVELRDFGGEEVLVSDILFLDDIDERDDGKLVFHPRVSSLQNPASRILVYFEVYNVAPTDSSWVEYQVLDAEGKVMSENKYWNRSQGRITQNFVDLRGDELSHGYYSVKVKVKYKGQTRELHKEFDWYLEGMPRFLADIDEAIDVLKYVASKEDYKYLRNLAEEDKYDEFVKFWAKLDPTPETNENELLDAYYERVRYANENFGHMGKAGWKTDRGWVHILLGPPDTINREPYYNRSSFGKTVKAIQVWVYHKYNRQLVFFDDDGFGDYRLQNPATLYEILR